MRTWLSHDWVPHTHTQPHTPDDIGSACVWVSGTTGSVVNKRERERERERENSSFSSEKERFGLLSVVVVMMMMMWRFPGEFLHVDEAREKVRLWWDDLMLFSLTEAVPVGGASASPVHTHLSDSHTPIGLRNTLQFSS